MRYRKPTPLHTELLFEGRTDRKDGRRIIAKGTLDAGGEVTAEAEGIFVTLSVDRAVEYLDRSQGGRQ